MALMLLKDLSADERRDPSKVTKGVLSKITLKDNTGTRIYENINYSNCILSKSHTQ